VKQVNDTDSLTCFMISKFDLLTLFLCLVVLGGLSGCSALAVVTIEALSMLPIGASDPDPPDSHRTGENHYETVILTSNENMVTIKYLSVGPNAEHEQVVQLIIEHCDGAYIETSRAELRGYTTVDAECIDGSESLQ
jgi:hypothetical protein